MSSILENMERKVSPDQIKSILEDLIGEQAMPYSTNYVDYREYLSVLSVLMTVRCCLDIGFADISTQRYDYEQFVVKSLKSL